MKQTTLVFSPSNKLAIKTTTSNKVDDEFDLFSMSSSSNSNSGIKKSNKTKSDKLKCKKRLEQLYIDCGQSSFKSIKCSKCQMVYMNGSLQDEKVHSKFCKSVTKLMKYKVHNKDIIKMEEYPYKIILINNNSPTCQQKKAKDIIEYIDRTCLQCTLPYSTQTHSMFIYLNDETNEIMGICVAERIIEASPAYMEKSIIDSNDKQVTTTTNNISEEAEEQIITQSSITEQQQQSNICSWDCKQKRKAVCGINRIWVKEEFRRMKIASQLIDCIREHFIYGCILQKKQVAFSPPTANGASFAKNYCNNEIREADFLIYVNNNL
ncbi:hypothetical protein ABK040_014371 [Willaertia magna]